MRTHTPTRTSVTGAPEERRKAAAEPSRALLPPREDFAQSMQMLRTSVGTTQEGHMGRLHRLQ